MDAEPFEEYHKLTLYLFFVNLCVMSQTFGSHPAGHPFSSPSQNSPTLTRAPPDARPDGLRWTKTSKTGWRGEKDTLLNVDSVSFELDVLFIWGICNQQLPALNLQYSKESQSRLHLDHFS